MLAGLEARVGEVSRQASVHEIVDTMHPAAGRYFGGRRRRPRAPRLATQGLAQANGRPPFTPGPDPVLVRGAVGRHSDARPRVPGDNGASIGKDGQGSRPTTYERSVENVQGSDRTTMMPRVTRQPQSDRRRVRFVGDRAEARGRAAR
jgi:hypothetical protein